MLQADEIALLDLARSVPAICLAWAGGAAVGAASVLLLLLGPVVAFLSLLLNLGLSLLVVGGIALLPAPMGAGQVGWLVLAVSAAVHAGPLASVR